MTEHSITETSLTGESLTLAEVQRLGELEQVVETGLTVFVKVGNALLEIRDSRLYRQQFPTFEAYCRERWGLKQSRAYQLLDAAVVVGNLQSSTIVELPKTESQARPLTRLEPEVQREVWQDVVETTHPEQITAKIVGEKAKAAEPLNAIVKTLKAEMTSPLSLAPPRIAVGDQEIIAAAKEIRAEKTRENTQERDRLKARVTQIQPPNGKYRCIVIDPPWDMQKIERDVRPQQVGFDYPTMSEAELQNFDVPGLADAQCHLFLWTTHKHLPLAFRLMDAWGFKYIFTMVWHKPGGFQPLGLAQYNCEFVLFGRQGGLDFLDTKAFPACFQAPRREHSRKPDEFYTVVRRVSPGPRIDVFSREARDGFDQYGNEINKFSEAAA